MGGELFILVFLLFATAVLAVLGYVVLVAPVRENPRLCARRRFAHGLGCLGFLVGGVYWVFTWSDRSRLLFGNPVGGLVFGALVGELIGAFVALHFRAAGEEEGL